MNDKQKQAQAALEEIREIELPAGRYKINGEYRDVPHTFCVKTALEAMAGDRQRALDAFVTMFCLSTKGVSDEVLNERIRAVHANKETIIAALKSK